MIKTVSLVGRQHSVKVCKISDCHRAYVLQDTAYSMVRNKMDTEFGRLCEQIKESREKRGTCFNAKDFKTCLCICNWKCTTKIFGIYSLLQGRTSPAWSPWDDSKSPQQNPATEDDKPDEESNENEAMTAAPVDASTPISNGKLHFIQLLLSFIPSLFLRRNRCLWCLALYARGILFSNLLQNVREKSRGHPFNIVMN